MFNHSHPHICSPGHAYPQPAALFLQSPHATMQNTRSNGKRPAPGTSPMMQQPMPQQDYQYQQVPDTADFSNFDFSQSLGTNQGYSDPGSYDANNFAAYGLNNAQPQTYGSNLAQAVPSTELVRRTRNQQLAPQNGQQEQWNGAAAGGVSGTPDDEDDADLERRADAAMKEGLAKRKQIPPFVQKLSR